MAHFTLRIAIIGFLLLSTLALFNTQLGLLGFLFDLPAHFTPHLMIGGSGVGVFLLTQKRWGLAAVFIVSSLAHGAGIAKSMERFAPVISYKVSSTKIFRVASANVFTKKSALAKFIDASRRQTVDLVAVSEAPANGCDVAQSRAPDFQFCLLLETEKNGASLSRRLMLLAREAPMSVLPHFDQSFMERSFIEAEVMVGEVPLKIVVVHPVAPGTPNHRKARDAMLRAAADVVNSADESFALVGDMNTTPWASIFHQLPGKRVGNALLHSTWLTGLPLVGLPIDHVIVGNDVTATSFEIGEFNGSDHRPLFVEVGISNSR